MSAVEERVLKLRWLAELSIFVLLGACAALAITSIHSGRGLALFVIAPLAVLFVPAVLAKGAKSVLSVMRSFTWWQALWLLLFISGLTFRDRTTQTAEAEPVDAWASFRIALVAVTGLVLFLRLALKQTPWLKYLFRSQIGILAGYCLVCMASSVWSIYPPWTFYKSVEYFVDVALLAAIVASARSVPAYKRLFDWTWCLSGILLVSAWIGVILWPQEALSPTLGLLGVQLVGIVPNISSNTISELGALVGVIAFARLMGSTHSISDRGWYGLLLTMGLVSMGLAQGRSGILGFAVGVILVLSLSGHPAVSACVALTGALALSGANAWGTLSEFMRRGETEEELYSLSSRVDWWSLAWPKIVEHPMIGYGAFAGGRFFALAQAKVDVSGVHSDWVEILIGTGLWGFIPALLALLGTWWQLARSFRDSFLTSRERQLTIEAIGALGVISIRSIFSSDLFWHFPMVFLAVLGYAQFLRIGQRHKSTVMPPVFTTA